MFDLDREIDRWCRNIVERGCARSTSLDELKDHLYCLVEEQCRRDKSEPDAFVAAIKQMGDSKLITAEYSKNNTLLRRIAAYDRKIQRSITGRFSGKQLTWFILFYSLFCAGLMLLLSMVYTGSEYRGQFINWIMVVWFIPFIFVVTASKIRKTECAFFERLFRTKKVN